MRSVKTPGKAASSSPRAKRAARPGGRTFPAAHYRTGERVDFTVTPAGRLQKSPGKGAAEFLFGPGLFDLQCNGYAGIDYNSADTTAAEILASLRAMLRHGCTRVLPTVITGQQEQMEAHFRKLEEARAAAGPELAACFPGYHMEGPFISPVDGARGAHPLDAVRDASVVFWNRMQRAAGRRILMVTLAPEVRGALSLTRRLAGEGVAVALGHTMATRDDVRNGVAAGARISTHLGNGCPQMMHRHLNPVFAQLGEDALTATFIPDGIHLPPEVLRSYVRAKGLERSVIVTDAMSGAGAPPGRYKLAGHILEVGADRVVRAPGAPHFAGSALAMHEAVSGFAAMTGLPLAEAWDAASLRAAEAMARGGVPRATLKDGSIVLARLNPAKPASDLPPFQPVAAFRGQHVLWAEAT